jgi:uncharacterized OB-fold protein
MTTTGAVHAIDGLFADTTEGPRLLGSRCGGCGTAYFPRTPLCHNPACTGSAIADAALGGAGKLWSVAIQNYPPGPPAKFDQPYRPYALGLVDTSDGLRVLARIAADDPSSVAIGCDVTLVIDELYREDDGRPVLTWKYRPVT